MFPIIIVIVISIIYIVISVYLYDKLLERQSQERLQLFDEHIEEVKLLVISAINQANKEIQKQLDEQYDEARKIASGQYEDNSPNA